MDMSAHSQVLKNTPADSSLLWSGELSTMFAVGKAATPTTPLPPDLRKQSQPLLRCLYERRAPTLTSVHTLDVRLSPISIMYHSLAYESLKTFFDTTEYVQRPAEEIELKEDGEKKAAYRPSADSSLPTEIRGN